ncbi:hypothetical protein PENSUB_3239 [Penicillium subrubescens]|uniref:Uncharacterized protein n=1 Tax=Penicillium subrubescens TaxID=1316194 RepID=A0A1Q5UFH1_9EURO|nr:hypothetical protein PENSUB_3239 [Penicillium subrubescens]
MTVTPTVTLTKFRWGTEPFTYLKLTSIDIWPEAATAANLVWNSDTGTLTWVNVRYCADITPQPWNDLWLARFKPVKVPNNSWAEFGWNSDTSEWKF